MILPREGTILKSRGFSDGIQIGNEMIQTIFPTQMGRVKDFHPIPPADYLCRQEQQF